MRKYFFLTLLLVAVTTFVNGQTGHDNFREGFLLRRLELASSYAVSYLKADNKEILKKDFQNISYQNNNNEIETLIFSGFESPELLVRFKFDSLPKATPLATLTTKLELTSVESELIRLLADATHKINSRYQGNFSPTTGTEFRAIPVVSNKQKKVFVYCQPSKNFNYVLLGNDYELQYDSVLNFRSIRKYHKKENNVPLSSNQGMVTVHEHTTNDEISPTDVCSLLLNKERIKWKQHIVLNPKYVAIFNLDKENSYILMMREEFDEVMKKQQRK